MKSKTNSGLFVFLGLFISMNSVLADEYSEGIFSKNLGSFSGRFEDGLPCEMIVKESSWDGGYEIVLKEKNGTEATGSTRCQEGRICTGEFKRKGVFKYHMEMFRGAGISSGGRNTVSVYKVFTKSGRVYGFEVEKMRNGERYTCTFENN